MILEPTECTIQHLKLQFSLKDSQQALPLIFWCLSQLMRVVGEISKKKRNIPSSIPLRTWQRKSAFIFLPSYSSVYASLVTRVSHIPLWNNFYCFFQKKQFSFAQDEQNRKISAYLCYQKFTRCDNSTALKNYISFATMNSFSPKAFISLLCTIPCWDIL